MDRPAGIAEQTRTVRVALIGNPNTGKSTVFNALAGMNTRTGNYPGVTVEKKVGRIVCGETVVELIDLPGTYSLAPRSPDELVAVEVMTGEQAGVGAIDVVLCIANATVLRRSLFLLSQLLEIGRPVVLAVNMHDVAVARGVEIDAEALGRNLGIPVVLTSAHRRRGTADLIERLLAAADGAPPPAARPLPEAFYAECARVRETLAEASGASPAERHDAASDPYVPDPYVIERAVLDQNGSAERMLVARYGAGLAARLDAARHAVAEQCGALSTLESESRYRWAKEQLDGVIGERPSDEAAAAAGWTDRLDAVLTGRATGLVILAAVMFLVFQLVYRIAGSEYGPTAWLEAGQSALTAGVEGVLPPGMFRSLLVDGAIAGVGGVLVFVPQIALLFLIIALLEDCGYMARAAFLVDRVMSGLGLSGKSFLPLMSSFACAVPGVMATRVIDHPRDRLATIMIAPLMSCSARLPVYLLLIAAFVPATTYLGGWIGLQGLVLMSMYLLGIVVAVPVAWIFKKTLLRGEPAPFVMELPEYKVPGAGVVVSRVWEAVKAFVVRAGTLIFAATILIWFAGYVPGDRSRLHRLQAQAEGRGERAAAAVDSEALDAAIHAESARLLEHSLLGRMGHAIEPVVRPLGWDWKIGVGAIASFPAREVIIATLGTIYSLGGEVDEGDEGLIAALRSARHADGRPVYSVPVALSIMVFFALCAQCVSTLLVIRRETNSWLWPVVSFTYMTVLAYVGALLTFQIGSRILG